MEVKSSTYKQLTKCAGEYGGSCRQVEMPNPNPSDTPPSILNGTLDLGCRLVYNDPKYGVIGARQLIGNLSDGTGVDLQVKYLMKEDRVLIESADTSDTHLEVQKKPETNQEESVFKGTWNGNEAEFTLGALEMPPGGHFLRSFIGKSGEQTYRLTINEGKKSTNDIFYEQTYQP